MLDHALAHPCHGPVRVAHELTLRVVRVLSGGVRGVWQCNKLLLTKRERLLRLEQASVETKVTLSDKQARLLGCFGPEFGERHIETPHTGSIVVVIPSS